MIKCQFIDKAFFFVAEDQPAVCRLLDPKQGRILCKSAVSVVCEDAFCEHFTKLNTLLVEAVKVPEEALEHDLILEMREKRTE